MAIPNKSKHIDVSILREHLSIRGNDLVWAKGRRGARHLIAGSLTRDGYRRFTLFGQQIFAHRAVFAITHGIWPNELIDHIDGDRKNNNPTNLREANATENCRNSQANKVSASGVHGVCWSKAANKWQAALRVDGKKVHLGVFSDLGEAATAVSQARLIHYGSFAPDLRPSP